MNKDVNKKEFNNKIWIVIFRAEKRVNMLSDISNEVANEVANEISLITNTRRGLLKRSVAKNVSFFHYFD